MIKERLKCPNNLIRNFLLDKVPGIVCTQHDATSRCIDLVQALEVSAIPKQRRSCWERFDVLEDEEVSLKDQLARLEKIRRGERMEVRCMEVWRYEGRRAVENAKFEAKADTGYCRQRCCRYRGVILREYQVTYQVPVVR